jgi:histidyl-tRNA synthetase
MITQTLKGFRDFLPKEALKRKFVIDTITSVFQKFGFDPLETPALEYGEVLTGKYGEEADKLLYMFTDRGGRNIGLRYDQTVPLARVVAEYQDIPKPFKRYQIQPVWRAENTQKGRYREFLQCDADIIGDSYSPTADAEILSLLYSVYRALGFKKITIVVNSRQILRKLINDSLMTPPSEEIFLSIVRSIDKLDKIAEEGVKAELLTKEIPEAAINELFTKISKWSSLTYKELESVDSNLYSSLKMAIENFQIPETALLFNPTLARGLDYYTGIIFEAVDASYPGSLGGGGRYDKLIGSFMGKDVTAVGFAIGFDRTLEVAEMNNLISTNTTVTKVLIAYEDDTDTIFPQALNLTATLREENINTEMYLNPKDKLEKQLKYADKKGIPYVVIVESEKLTLKDMTTGERKEVSLEAVVNTLRQT